MKKFGLIVALMTGFTLSACASVPTDNPTRSAAPQLPEQQLSVPVTQAQGAFDIQSVRVDVPRTLEVSEANRYYPGGDIVWREDPPGNRHAQVQKIVQDAMLMGVRGLEGGQVPAMLDIQVTRFHALTEKARYTVGGVHALQFVMILRDPETGAALSEPKFVKADFKAFGGQQAVAAERAGQTQKVRITNHLAGVIQQELTSPEGHTAANLGLMGAINQL